MGKDGSVGPLHPLVGYLAQQSFQAANPQQIGRASFFVVAGL